MSGVPAWSGPRTAIVTGGGSGIGAAICRRLAVDGARVAVVDRDPDGAAATVATIVELGGEAIAVTADVADRDDIDAAVATVRERLGAATILVNNAGISPFEKFADITRESWERTIAINLRGPFELCQAAVPDMIAAGWGRIVNIASSTAQIGNARQVHYAASKAGVLGLTKSLAKELGPKGITVNAVPPSFIETPGLHTAADGGFLGGGIDQHVSATPVRRVGRPDDIAAACAFLVRDDAAFITGQVLGVNGGRVIV